MMITSRLISIFFLSLLLAISGVAHAQNTPPYPPYVQNLANQGAQVRYMGNDLGLSAWLTVKGGRTQYVYVTPNEEANLVGVLLDRDGQLITDDQIKRLVEANPNIASTVDGGQQAPANKDAEISPGERLYNAFETANWFEIGAGEAPAVYALIDPDCPHCHAFIKDVQAAKGFESGKMKARLIPVGVMNAESLRKAAFLIAAPNAGASFLAHIGGDEAAIPFDGDLNTDGVLKNMRLVQDWNLTETPIILYKNAKGEVKVIRGRPKNLENLFADLP